MSRLLIAESLTKCSLVDVYTSWEYQLIVRGHSMSIATTGEPLKKGHFRANSFVPCREVVPILEVK